MVKLLVLLPFILASVSCPIKPPKPTPTPTPFPRPTPAPFPRPSPSSSPYVPPDPCMVALCPPTQTCVVLDTKPPTAACVPKPELCPVECREPQWIGVAFRSRVPVNPKDGGWLGWRYNWDATPHTTVEACQDRPGQATEQRKDCQDPEGPDFYMTLPDHFTNDRCDQFSMEPYWCHHKPEGPNGASGKGAQVGPTTVCVVPNGAPVGDPRGRCVTTAVQP